MSENEYNKKARRRFFRRQERSSSEERAESFDDVESLGMESGTGRDRGREPRRVRFPGRRSKSGGSGRPMEVLTRPMEVTITTTTPTEGSDMRPRISSHGDLSLEGLSGPDSESVTVSVNLIGSKAEKVSGPLSGLRKRLVRNRRSSPASEKPATSSDAASDKSSLQHSLPTSIQNSIPQSNLPAGATSNSFDSGDTMLNHVRKLDPTVSYRRGRGVLKTARFSIPPPSSDESDPSIKNESLVKKISFGDSSSQLAEETSNRTVDFAVSPSYGSTATTQNLSSSVQTYRSVGSSSTQSTRAGFSASVRTSKKKFRVKPFHCFTGSVCMTEEEIYNDSTKPSMSCEMLRSYLAPSTTTHKGEPVSDEIVAKYGTPATDGRIGSLRCEVLGCVSLARKSKPDVCVYLVAGDAAFCTDIIQGFRSPMWPSASRRACVFPVHHAYQRLYAGVFDVRARKNKENDVFCGRVSIDVASLRPNTEYDITFPLRASTFVYDKHKRGVLRLRFSLHWFSERAAVLSYFYSPRTLDQTSPLVQGSPTIPCADPKTFRNVAVTVHGNDLPGKYSKVAFKATVREFQLYQLNIRRMLWYTWVDAVLYEKPYISVYLFLAGMHCVITESVSKVPPYFMGFLIILYLENYKHYVADTLYNDGYQQLTLVEVCKALVSKTGSDDRYFEPILVTKRAKQRAQSRSQKMRKQIGDSAGVGSGEEENAPLDHREFPFSDRQAYPKLLVENALAPGAKNAGGNTRLHGRLSVYYAPTPDANESSNMSGDEEEEDSSDDSDGNETIIEGAGMFDQAFDDDMDDDYDGGGKSNSNSQYGYGDNSAYGYGEENQSNDKIRRIIHQTQNIDDSGGAAVPPQVTVKKVENMFHKNSLSLAVEKVAAPPTKEHIKSALSNAGGNEKLALTTEDIEKEIEERRKAYLDEFDKLLGLQAKSSNPISRMLSTFLGPLMRILRIPIFMFRIGFNAATWRDPYLSFWLFCSMCVTLLILMAFPWRLFFFLAILVGLGPQNIFLRKFLESRAKKKKEEEYQKQIESISVGVGGESNQSSYGMTGISNVIPGSFFGQKSVADDSDTMSVRSGRRGFFGRRKDRNRNNSGEMSDFIVPQNRPPFCSDIHGVSNRKLQPRSVVIPYSKLRKERFFDWPPDPTVSRATPMEMERWPQDQERLQEMMAPDNINLLEEGEEEEGEDEDEDGDLEHTPSSDSNMESLGRPHRRRLSAGGNPTGIPGLRKRRGSL